MLARRPLHLLFVATLLLLCAQATRAQETWVARSGLTTIHMNAGLMRDLGVTLADVRGTAPTPPKMDLRMEDPHWSFDIDPATDLRFLVDHGISLPYGIIDGAIRHEGSFVFGVGGSIHEVENFEIAYIPATVDGPAGPHPSDAMYFRAGGAESSIVCRVEDSMFDFHRDEETLYIHYMNFSIAEGWANEIGRPDLAGWTVAMAEVVVTCELAAGAPSGGSAYVPNFVGNLDVSLGLLRSITQVGHDGTYPTGTAALSMATTSCNLGDVDVPWYAPMAEDHPLIHMAIYRMANDVLEQIGVSYMKHGFYALSNSDCTQCQNYSDGTFLGVGCSDTYGVMNNADRNYLGPRSEVNPYKSTWTCTGSHFAGGQPDCVRRHGASGHGALDHRLTASDADLGLPGSAYFYESNYLVHEDVDKSNNIGSRLCTMTWTGSVWDFNTPSVDNPLVEGPAIDRFGEIRTTVPVATGDGSVILAVHTKDLGGSIYHYEYALFNFDSDRQIRSLTLPVGGALITNIGFHDADSDPTNDWQVTLENGTIRWETDTYANDPSAHALEHGLMFNLRFDADAPPSPLVSSLGVFKPSTPSAVDAATVGPMAPASAGAQASNPLFRLDPARPNPSNGSTVIPFELGVSAAVELAIFDSRGDRVRTILSGRFGAGSHEAIWDGRDTKGKEAPSGVYYCRLADGVQAAVRSVAVVR